MTRGRAHALLDREARLLVLAARHAPDPDVARRLLRGRVDWARLTWLAHREHAVPALWSLLAPLDESEVPAFVALRLRQANAQVQARMEAAEGHLDRVVEAAAAVAPPPMLLKGAALARTTYGSMARRPMGDLDLLFPPHAAGSAWRAIRALGWRPEGGPDQTRIHRDHHHHLVPLLEPTRGELAVECHTALFRAPVFRLDLATLEAEARPVRCGHAEARVPAPELLLLHAALHLAWSNQLRSAGWRTLRDADRLVRAGVDWDRFEAHAHAARGASCAYWTLRLARGLVDTPVPPDVLERLAPPGTRRGRGRLETVFAGALFPGAGRCPSPGIERGLWTRGLRPRQQDHGTHRPWLRGDFARERAALAGRSATSRGQAWTRALRTGIWLGRTLLAAAR